MLRLFYFEAIGRHIFVGLDVLFQQKRYRPSAKTCTNNSEENPCTSTCKDSENGLGERLTFWESAAAGAALRASVAAGWAHPA